MENLFMFIVTLFTMGQHYEPPIYNPPPSDPPTVEITIVDDHNNPIAAKVFIELIGNNHTQQSFELDSTSIFKTHLSDTALYTAVISAKGYYTERVRIDAKDKTSLHQTILMESSAINCTLISSHFDAQLYPLHIEVLNFDTKEPINNATIDIEFSTGYQTTLTLRDTHSVHIQVPDSITVYLKFNAQGYRSIQSEIHTLAFQEKTRYVHTVMMGEMLPDQSLTRFLYFTPNSTHNSLFFNGDTEPSLSETDLLTFVYNAYPTLQFNFYYANLKERALAQKRIEWLKNNFQQAGIAQDKVQLQLFSLEHEPDQISRLNSLYPPYKYNEICEILMLNP